jgi:hypothetical protein
MHRFFRAALCLLAVPIAAASATAAPIEKVLLTLQNGWTNAPFSTSKAYAQLSGGVVAFRGAIATSGTNTNPFTLPAEMVPSTEVYVPVDMCNATKGRLLIGTDGTVTVQAETDFSNAQCFTSLDGVSFVQAPTSKAKPLHLKNGWKDTIYGTAAPAVEQAGGVVRFIGAVSQPSAKTNSLVFTLPPPLRPAAAVYVPVDMCSATNGRLLIETNGDVLAQAESDYSNAQCFTSLDGASFVLSGGTPLALINGWTNAPFGTRSAAVSLIAGTVRLSGAIATSGSVAQPFVLGAGLTPAKDTYVNIDLCDATKGRLYIEPNGTVTVQAETDFSNAQCFTSLDGASFVK